MVLPLSTIIPLLSLPHRRVSLAPLNPFLIPTPEETAPSVVPDLRLLQTEIRNWAASFH